MLVLSRNQNDQILFPTLGISVEILRVSGSKVRLGIDAPREIPVVRHELADQSKYDLDSEPPATGSPQLTHAERNQIHTALMGLHILRKKFELGEVSDAEATIFKIFNELKKIEDGLSPIVPDTQEPSATNKVYRTLLVEDDRNERELLAGYLRMSGLDVDTAEDGLQAMAHLAKHERPDVVLMDMRMPRFDGHSAVTAIRANPDYRRLKVFAVSGTKQSELPVEVGPNGVDRWFAKPVNPETIVSAINEFAEADCVDV